MPFFRSFDKAKIFYKYKKKNKCTLVFIHGWTHNLTAWRPQAEYYQNKGFSTVEIDIVGHGLSSCPTEKNRYSIENMARDVVQLLQKLKCKNNILIGHSMGGMIAITAYREAPQNISGLVLIGSTYRNPLTDAKVSHKPQLISFCEKLISYLETKKVFTAKKKEKHYDYSAGKHSSDFGYWIEGLQHTVLRAVLYSFDAMRSFEEEKTLSIISVPTLLIASEGDIKTPLTVMQRMRDLIPNAELRVTPGSDHDLNILKPEVIRKHMDKFLQKFCK